MWEGYNLSLYILPTRRFFLAVCVCSFKLDLHSHFFPPLWLLIAYTHPHPHQPYFGKNPFTGTWKWGEIHSLKQAGFYIRLWTPIWSNQQGWGGPLKQPFALLTHYPAAKTLTDMVFQCCRRKINPVKRRCGSLSGRSIAEVPCVYWCTHGKVNNSHLSTKSKVSLTSPSGLLLPAEAFFWMRKDSSALVTQRSLSFIYSRT